jgi:hypothetical protein
MTQTDSDFLNPHTANKRTAPTEFKPQTTTEVTQLKQQPKIHSNEQYHADFVSVNTSENPSATSSLYAYAHTEHIKHTHQLWITPKCMEAKPVTANELKRTEKSRPDATSSRKHYSNGHTQAHITGKHKLQRYQPTSGITIQKSGTSN